MAKEDKKIDPKRVFPVDVYLKDAKLSEPIKVMMKQLYKGQSKTLEEWAKEDEKRNKGRVK